MKSPPSNPNVSCQFRLSDNFSFTTGASTAARKPDYFGHVATGSGAVSIAN